MLVEYMLSRIERVSVRTFLGRGWPFASVSKRRVSFSVHGDATPVSSHMHLVYHCITSGPVSSFRTQIIMPPSRVFGRESSF